MKDRPLKERRTGTTQTVSFNADSLDLHDYVLELARDRFNENISYAILDCIKVHQENRQISIQDLVNTLMDKIDNLSLIGIPVEQREQIKEEVKEAGFKMGEGPLFE